MLSARLRNGWPNLAGLRARATLAAAVVAAAALAIAAVGLLLVLRWQWTLILGDGLQERTQEVANQLETDFDQGAAILSAIPGTTNVVQVLAADGTVLLASPGLAGAPPLVVPDPAQTDPSVTTARPQGLDGAGYLVATVPASSPDGPVLVVGAASLEQLRDVTQASLLALALVVLALLLVVAAVTWRAVGRSLADVERIRSRVETIDAAGLSDRVPVPPTGDEIADLAETMNGMLDRLDRSATAQRRFLADASHELRSPIASMRSALDVAAESSDPADWGDSAEVLSDEVDRMSRLVGDLLLLARADEGVLCLTLGAVDLDELVAAEARRLRSHTDLEVVVDLRPIQVTADEQRLGRALRNLVDNAARFAEHKVHLSTSLDHGAPVIAVADDGPGVPVELRAEILQRFVRVDAHRARHVGGVGLGLAIVEEIVRLHDGSLEVGDSKLGGAKFAIQLPTGSIR